MSTFSTNPINLVNLISQNAFLIHREISIRESSHLSTVYLHPSDNKVLSEYFILNTIKASFLHKYYRIINGN